MGKTKYILLIGIPGSGKTWVLKKIIAKLKLYLRGKTGMFLYHRNEKVCVVGKYDGSTFEGSDRLSMALMRDLDLFLSKDFGIVIVEGDRFTNSTFINKAKPFIIKILDDGVKGRAKRGSNQTERQIKSMTTRVNNVKSDFDVRDSSAALKKIFDLIE